MPQLTPMFDPKTLGRIALVIGFIQFTNALEYMALTPVFAFMADGFSVPVSCSGYVSAMYTLGAVLSGSAAFYFIDRFNQKRFLLINMLLLGALTFLCTLTAHFGTLLALRFFAGVVGGTTMGVGISMLINAAPANLRGKMLAAVIASFSMVSIVGMPAILFLCTRYGWHTALWSISVLCLLSLPPIVGILPADTAPSGVKAQLPLNSHTLLFASVPALVQFSPMLIIPVLTPLLVQSFGASLPQLPLLFLSGGIAGYLATKLTGMLTSRLSGLTLATVSTLFFIVSLMLPAMGYHCALLFITVFLAASYSRLVVASSVAMQYPRNEQRAAFSSLQTAIMSLLTTLAFFLSSLLLPGQEMTPELLNRLLFVSALVASGFPVTVVLLQRKLNKRHSHPAPTGT